MVAKAEQSIIITLPLSPPRKDDYSNSTQRIWLDTEYAVKLYNELKDALGF